MSRAQGHLSAVTVAVIFVLVFGGMYQVVEFAQDPDLPEDPAEDTEKLVRAAVWERVNDHRAEAGLFAASTTAQVEIEAQQTAERLAAEGALAGPIASGSGFTNEPVLPNPGARCVQFAVPVEVSQTDSVPVPVAVRDDIADQALSGFREVDTNEVLERGPWANNGIGVAIDDSMAYVTYRSCSTRRFSP